MAVSQTRITSVDIARGAAIFLMIYTHFFRIIVGFMQTPSLIINYLDVIASFLSVPLFYFVSGFAFYLSMQSKTKYLGGEIFITYL